MESAIALELLRRRNRDPFLEFYYWRDPHGKEVDFVLKRGTEVEELIQSCYDPRAYGTMERELGPLLKAGRELGCDRLRIVTWDEEGEETVEGKRVVLEPLWRWLLGPGAARPEQARDRARDQVHDHPVPAEGSQRPSAPHEPRGTGP